jgi:FKBP-type peptidyl-prolyl cis-trans isomerase SlyD
MAEQLKIGPGRVVSIDYRLQDGDGALIEDTEGEEPLTYLHGHGQLIPGLERQLEGKAAGDQGRYKVPASEAYGERDPQKVFTEPKERFGFEVEEGQVLQASLEDGGAVSFVVVSVDGEGVTLDGNHPLAGKDLDFDITVRAVRPATAEELTHGHAHDGCHDHR